jgi:hypothetical protein
MSLTIGTAVPQTNVNDLTANKIAVSSDDSTSSSTPKITSSKRVEAKERNLFSSALDDTFHLRNINDEKSLKALSHLSESLDKAYSNATSVDQETSEREIKHGGLKRVGKDLRKLFKGMGLPPQAAKTLSRGITYAMKEDSTSQINFSLTTSRSTAIEFSQTQTGYLASGDGTEEAVSTSNSLKISALRVRSFDFSINMDTGEYSFNHSQSDQLTVSASQSAVAFRSLPEESGTSPSEQGDNVESEQQTDREIAAVFQSDRTLFSLSQTVQNSALMQITPVNDTDQEIDESEKTPSEMKPLEQQLSAVRQQPEPLFESLTRIRNLRIDVEREQTYLRFSADAIAPVGLSTTDEQGNNATLYPRSDGSLAKTEDSPLAVTA